MAERALRFGAPAWVATADVAAAGRIAYVGTRASLGSDGRQGLRTLRDAGARVVAVWAPEHGFDAAGGHGQRVDDGAGSEGCPVFGLYGARTAPDDGMLSAVDTIVYDLQDAGARYYTFWHVLKQCLTAAFTAGKAIVVCDRPNPLGDARWGNVLPAACDGPVGCWPTAMQHGLTIADVAVAWHRTHPDARVECVRVEGWRGQDEWGALGVAWCPPSPNLPTLDAVAAYPGTCLGEGLHVSVGRGTPWPFQWLGAPWLGARAIAEAVNVLECGWVAREETCTPEQDPYRGVRCSGVHLTRTAAGADPLPPALTVLRETLARHADDCGVHAAHLDALAGGPDIREGLLAGESVPTLMHSWAAARRSAGLRSTHTYA